MKGKVLLTLSQTSPGFYVSAAQVYSQMGEVCVTSNFSFSFSVFFPFRELSTISIKFQIVVCKLFQFRRAKNCHLGKD